MNCPICRGDMITSPTEDGVFVCLNCNPTRDDLMRELGEARQKAFALGVSYDRREAAQHALAMLGKSSPIVRILCLEILSET